MSPKGKNLKRKLVPQVSQVCNDSPLAPRTKAEEEQYQTFKRITTEVDEDAWVKAVKLIKGEWNPFPSYSRCYVRSSMVRERGVGICSDLVLQFKRAVLSHNWTNAVRLALAIFKNYHKFNERTYLQVLLCVLMSHPQVNEDLLTKTCSFLWQMEKKDAMAKLLRCFCSMPKALPTEFFNQTMTRVVYARAERASEKKSSLKIRYTTHIEHDNCEDNDMYIQ